MKFIEYILEESFIYLFAKQGYPYVFRGRIQRKDDELLIEGDLLQVFE